MSGVNPQGVQVSGFKVPSADELDHDYLWRYACRLPARGDIGIFNRSHYEEVLVVRVHPEHLDRQKLPAEAKGRGVWERRYREINDWERYLTDNGFKMVKLFLNLSKEEQRTRFFKRLDLPEKNWKFSAADVRERLRWDDYQQAFSQMLSATSTPWAPWYVIPADHKWFARICAAAVLARTLIEIDPQYPEVTAERRKELLVVKGELQAQAPKGAPADPFAAKQAKQEAKNAKKAKKAKKAAAKAAAGKVEAGEKAEASQAAGDGHRAEASRGQPARASRARSRTTSQGGATPTGPRAIRPSSGTATAGPSAQPSPKTTSSRAKASRASR
jgi:PPK2 family polyphosphate:nucleotide phosphotransferase